MLAGSFGTFGFPFLLNIYGSKASEETLKEVLGDLGQAGGLELSSICFMNSDSREKPKFSTFGKT